MTFHNYFYNSDESDNVKSYEELLLLNYDNYLDESSIGDFSDSKESEFFSKESELLNLLF